MERRVVDPDRAVERRKRCRRVQGVQSGEFVQFAMGHHEGWGLETLKGDHLVDLVVDDDSDGIDDESDGDLLMFILSNKSMYRDMTSISSDDKVTPMWSIRLPRLLLLSPKNENENENVPRFFLFLEGIV